MNAKKVFGRFEVTDVLGRGGMGTVYRALDPVIGRTVAIKEIAIQSNLSQSEKAEIKARYELEFRAAGTLTHPNVVTIYDVGQDGDSYYIAMELVEGMSLADALTAGEPMEPTRVLDLARQIAAGIDYAHEHNIVHRDVKPANVLLTRDDRAKITDFGLVKMQMLASRLTQAGTVLGTPAYMSPEQVLGRSVDFKTDQFSFAVVLYQMLTGDTPFQAEHPSAILYKIVNEEPKAPAERNVSLPPGVDEVILRALAKSPEQRFSSCAELTEALGEALSSTPLESESPTFGERSFPEERIPTAERFGRTVRVAHSVRRPWLRWIAGAAGIAVLAVGGYLASSRFQTSLELDAPVTAEDHRPTGTPIQHVVSVISPIGGTVWVDASLLATIEKATPIDVVVGGMQGEQKDLELRVGNDVLDRLSVTLDAKNTGRTQWTVQLSSKLQQISITSQPDGARVFVDGARIDTVTPTQVGVAPGQEISLRLELEGYEDASWSFTLDDLSAEQRQSSHLHFPLASSVPPGILVITSPYPVDVRIGTRRVSASSGTTSIDLPPGNHEVELVAAKVFLRHAYRVAIESGQESPIQAPQAVPVLIAATPANCRVSIDGTFVDVTPIKNRHLVVGRHEFVFDWPAQGRTKTRQVTVSRAQQSIFEALE